MRMSEVVLEERGCDAMKVLESDSPPKPHSPARTHEHNATHTQHQERAHNECVKEQSCLDLSNQTQVSGTGTDQSHARQKLDLCVSLMWCRLSFVPFYIDETAGSGCVMNQ